MPFISYVAAAGGPPPTDLVIGRFDGTDGQTTSVPNDGALGGDWSFAGGTALSTTRAFNGSASLKLARTSGSSLLEIASLAHAGVSVPRLTPKTLEMRLWVATGGTATAGVSLFDWRAFISDPAAATLGITIASHSSAGSFRFLAHAEGTFLSLTPAVLTRDAWHHIAVSSDSAGVVRWFADGVLQSGTYTLFFNDGHASPRVIANAPNSAASTPAGWVDDLRYSQDRTYATSFTPPASV